MGEKAKPGRHREGGCGICEEERLQSWSFLDTAGRLHVDEDMMEELQQIKEAVSCRSDRSCT